jgi:tetratricopeptide (TPR) repeat protein
LITADYFDSHKSTERDFEVWKSGFSFELEAIREKKEFRRNEVLEQIEAKLENQQKLLIVGESGTSKSTVLMEVICDYVDKGYWVLWNRGRTQISNSDLLGRFIEGLLKSGKKVMIAVDNVHSIGTAAIFHIMNGLEKSKYFKNVRFILTARLPDFDQFISDDLHKVQEAYRESISKFLDSDLNPEFKYNMPLFGKKDIKNFIKLYSDPEKEYFVYDGVLTEDSGWKKYAKLSEEELDRISEQFQDYTKGIAIMVKFAVLEQDLDKDVQERYFRYLQGKPETIKIMLVCSLLEVADYTVSDEFLEKMKLLRYALDLRYATLSSHSKGWSTVHLQWAYRFLSFMFSKDDEKKRYDNIEYLKNAISAVLDVKDEKATASILKGIFRLQERNILPFQDVESITDPFFKNVPAYLGDQTLSELYILAGESFYQGACDTWGAGASDMRKSLHEKSVLMYDEATRRNPSSFDAWYFKSFALKILRRHEEAILCLDKAIEIAPEIPEPARRAHIDELLQQKCDLLLESEKYDESVACYSALMELRKKEGECPSLFDVGAWNNKGFALQNLQKHDVAIQCFDKAIEMAKMFELKRPDLKSNSIFIEDKIEAWIRKCDSLNSLGKQSESTRCYEEVLDLGGSLEERLFPLSWKAYVLFRLKRLEDAFEIITKITAESPEWEWGLSLEGEILLEMGRLTEAVECFDKVIELNPTCADAWYFKAIARVKEGSIEDGLADLEKAIGLDVSYSEFAKKDEDFEALRNDKRFKKLISRSAQKRSRSSSG